jgi:hypothetical protein
MLITGALNWWGERPEDLDACVRGLGNIAHRIVALDGAYARYPDATPHSSEDQLDAIRSAAKAVDLDCLIIQPDRLWAGQIEKRSYLLAAACVGSDWIVTVDADHVITADREILHTFLRKHPGDVISVPHITPLNPKRPLKDSAVGNWHVFQTTEPQFIPHIWRALPGMRVEKRHWWISAVKNGHRVWLWGGDETMPVVEHQRMRRDYTVEHRTLFRTKDQIRASRAFLNDRQRIVEQTDQEDNLPTLPPPVWDYRRVPF